MAHFVIHDGVMPASPAKCATCGYGNTDRRYLDPRLDFEFYGTFYLCDSCVGTIANDFDYLSPKQSATLIERLDRAEKELTVLRSAIIHLEEAHESLSDYHALINPIDSVGISDHEPDKLEKTATLTVGAGSISSSLESIGDSEIDELDSLERPDDVHSATARTEFDESLI